MFPQTHWEATLKGELERNQYVFYSNLEKLHISFQHRRIHPVNVSLVPHFLYVFPISPFLFQKDVTISLHYHCLAFNPSINLLLSSSIYLTLSLYIMYLSDFLLCISNAIPRDNFLINETSSHICPGAGTQSQPDFS